MSEPLETGKKQGHRFQKGVSGNPSGRPKDEIAPLARAKSKSAFDKLVKLMNSQDENIALKACLAVIERGYGKPIQTVEGNLNGTVTMMGTVKVNGQALELKIG